MIQNFKQRYGSQSVSWRMVQHIKFKRATRGWICEITLYVRTRQQSTCEWHEVREGSRFFFWALVRAYRAAWKEKTRLQRLSGEFALS